MVTVTTHEQLEARLALLKVKEDAVLLNLRLLGEWVGIIDVAAAAADVIVYDAESHACIIDGLRLHPGQRYVFSNIEDF